jgi:hypothetical protein
MDPHLEREVWRRAGDKCEYCRIPQSADIIPHQIDHVIAVKHGGETASDNLALACIVCNCHKGPNIAGLDPLNRTLTRLFHTRHDRWGEHFHLQRNGMIVGQSAVGRVTIHVLNMNDPDAVALRASLVAEGLIDLESPL